MPSQQQHEKIDPSGGGVTIDAQGVDLPTIIHSYGTINTPLTISSLVETVDGIITGRDVLFILNQYQQRRWHPNWY
jgi:hypothetical protein